MADGDADLFHRSGSQGGKADDVTRSVDVWDGGPIIFVDGDIAAVIDGEASPFGMRSIGRNVWEWKVWTWWKEISAGRLGFERVEIRRIGPGSFREPIATVWASSNEACPWMYSILWSSRFFRMRRRSISTTSRSWCMKS